MIETEALNYGKTKYLNEIIQPFKQDKLLLLTGFEVDKNFELAAVSQKFALSEYDRLRARNASDEAVLNVVRRTTERAVTAVSDAVDPHPESRHSDRSAQNHPTVRLCASPNGHCGY